MSRSQAKISLPAVRPSAVYSLNKINEYIENNHSKYPIKILDVGCGIGSALSLYRKNFKFPVRLEGLDISNYALKNSVVDKVHIGNAERMPFRSNSYHIVYSQYLIEHLQDANAALLEMARVVTDNGLIVLIFPNPTSLDGIVTRFTPYYFHVWFKKHIQKRTNAEGSTFPTLFSFRRVAKIANSFTQQGFEVDVQCFSETHSRFLRTPILRNLIVIYSDLLTKLKLDKIMSTVAVIARN